MRLAAELPRRSVDAYYGIVHCVLAPSFNECGYLIIIEDETMSELPIIGAALLVEEMPVHRDWYLEKPRDLEIQSYFAIQSQSSIQIEFVEFLTFCDLLNFRC